MARERRFYVYIITNVWDTTLYIGVTNDLFRRMIEHRTGIVQGFSSRYHLSKLVHYEEYTYPMEAFVREKQLKNWHRTWKLNLIREQNPHLRDLAAEWFGDAETSSA